VLLAADGFEIDAVAFAPEMTALQRDLRVTELHYHPAAASAAEELAGFEDPDEFEFIELTNIGRQTLDLGSLAFTAGVGFDFRGAAVAALAPGASLLLVRNRAAFEARYGTGLPVAGEFAGNGRLNDEGDTVRLEDEPGSVVLQFRYDDQPPWPVQPDGGGPSLEVVDLLGNYSFPGNWAAGSPAGGSPGAFFARDFEIETFSIANGQFLIGFRPGPVGTYRLLHKADLAAESWIPLAEAVSSSALGPITFVVPIPEWTPTGYFRVSGPIQP